MVSRQLAAWLLFGVVSSGHSAELTVSAASSLSESFRDIGTAFEAASPGDHVVFNFGASGALAQQILAGAPVDVFASADRESMDLAVQNGLVDAGKRHGLATNRLVVAVSVDSAVPLSTLTDLTAPTIERIAIGNPHSVPAGRYAKRALDGAGLSTAVGDKLIPTLNVRQALDYLSRSEVDAAFVYATDVRVMPDQVRIAFDVPLETPIRYEIAPVGTSANADVVSRFVAFVLGDSGQALLRHHGFSAP